MRRIARAPLVIAGGAVYDYDSAIVEQLTALDRSGKPYSVAEPDPTGRYLFVPRLLAKGVPAADKRTDGRPVAWRSTFEARDDEQARVVAECSALLDAGTDHVLQARPGFGKTHVALHLAALRGVATLVLVGTEQVRDQWIKAAQRVLGLDRADIGIVQGTKLQVDRPFVVALVPTLGRSKRVRRELFEGFGFVIGDEAHHAGAATMHRAMFLLPARHRLALTATPKRGDGRNAYLSGHFGAVRVTSMTYPVTPRVRIVHTTFNARVTNGDGDRVLIRHGFGRMQPVVEAMAKDVRRNAMLCRVIAQTGKNGRRVILFSALRAHLDLLHSRLIEGGHAKPEDIAQFVGGMKDEDRERAMLRPVMLATYAFAAEAVDLPTIDTLVLGTPVAKVEQVVGRILRGTDTGNPPRVIDPVDRYGMVIASYARARRAFYDRIGATVIDPHTTPRKE